MAETIHKIKAINPFAKDSHHAHVPPEVNLASRPQSKHNAPDDSKFKPLRSFPSGLSADASAQNAQDNASAYDSNAELPNSIDPLSRHIIHRTGSFVPVPTQSTKIASENQPLTSVIGDQSTMADHTRDQDADGTTKEKKKGVSFRSLARFIGNKKKDDHEEPVEDHSEKVDPRPEGANAQVFSHAANGLGYSPRHPQPPNYIKVRSHGKKEKDFNRVFLAQELQEEAPAGLGRSNSSLSQNRLRRTRQQTGDATWAMVFSMDGKYLATAGQDSLVRVWATLSSPDERRMFEKEEDADESINGEDMRLSAPVFRKQPIRQYEGHTQPILDLSWSKNNFLLSSSMDKTVRLWHVSRSECLCAFKHSDFVTSIQFHPRDDRFFLAGSLDSKLRLWSIPDKSVAFWVHVPEMITAVSFTPDGKVAIAGCVAGLCLFYDTEGLKYQTQIHVRSAHGKNAKGSKITGIQTINIPPTDPNGEVKMLVSTNDSRVRLYNFRDKSLEMKFKGNENMSSQIHARFSDDARYIICGSEDARVLIWDLDCSDFENKGRQAVEAFAAHNAATTVTLFAPTRARQLLSMSEDPLYDLCNPPPITLFPGGVDEQSERLQSPTNSVHRRAEESSAYISRSHHQDGHIIVTGDATGAIKVFRQDCAHEKRSTWDTASMYSRKYGSTSGAAPATTGPARSRQGSTSTQAPGERILSWRQEVPRKESLASLANASNVSKSNSVTHRGDSPHRHFGRFHHKPSSHHGTDSPPGRAATPTHGEVGVTNSDLKQIERDRAQPPGPEDDSGAPLERHPGSGEPAEAQARHDAQHAPHHHDHQPPPKSIATRPQPQRIDSNEYWRRDAWKDGVIQLLQESPREERHRGAGGPTSGDYLAVPPLMRGSSGVSAASRLTMEEESGASGEVSSAEEEEANGSSVRDGAGNGGMRRSADARGPAR